MLKLILVFVVLVVSSCQPKEPMLKEGFCYRYHEGDIRALKVLKSIKKIYVKACYGKSIKNVPKCKSRLMGWEEVEKMFTSVKGEKLVEQKCLVELQATKIEQEVLDNFKKSKIE